MPEGSVATKSEIPPIVPPKLGTSDVSAALGLTRDQVRHAVRMGRLEASQPWGRNTLVEYTPAAVLAFAEQAGIPVDWTALEP